MVTQHTLDTPYLVGPVHCYSLERDGDLMLFDTGPPTPEAKAYFREHLDLDRLKYIFITHCHIDHYGLAHWFEQVCGAQIYLPYRDALKITHHDVRMQRMYRQLQGIGFAETYLSELQSVFDSGVLFPPFPETYSVAEEGLPAGCGVEVLNCPGHSQSDVVYLFEEYAVTGDTLLKGIFQSPLLDIDLLTQRRFSNYSAYCESLVKLSGIEERTILPGHRDTVESVRGVQLFYIRKLLLRAKQLRPFRDEANIAKIIQTLFGDSMNDVFHIYLKASEICFMQDFLAEPELLGKALQVTEMFADVEEQYAQVTGR